LSILRKLLRLPRPKLFSTESAVVKKKTDINSFLTTYIRNRTSKFIGSTSKQGNNNNQTQAPSVPRAETSETPVSVPRTAPAPAQQPVQQPVQQLPTTP
jgi:hypothetical protein